MVVYFKDWAAIKSHYDERFDLTGLTPAEKELKDAVASGESCALDKTYPTEIADYLPPKPEDWSNPDPTRHIRADVLRFVLLQKVKHNEMTEAGTQLAGAQITDALNLQDATIPTLCGLIASRFENAITANRSKFKSQALFAHSIFPELSTLGATIEGQLAFNGARIEAVNGIALNLQGAQIKGDVMLDEVTAAGTIFIRGATIKGQLNCAGARFDATNGKALNLQGAKIGDHVVLRDISAASTIDMNNAAIKGQLICNGARFEAANGIALNLQAVEIGDSLFLREVIAASTIDIMGAMIKGQLICEGSRFEAANGTALKLQGAQIGDGFYFRNVKAVRGAIDLSEAKASLLVDDAESWALVDDLILDGFHYESIEGSTNRIFSQRMDWLEKGSVWNGDFFPQPYTQLADTYKRAGHDREARDVRIALAKKLNEHIRKDLVVVPNGDIKIGFKSAARDIWIAILWFWHKLQLLLTGHGFKPQRALYALILLVAACWFITDKAWHAGDFAPNSDVILLSEEWGTYESAPNHAKAWAKSQAGKDWESFSPTAYAADIVIPIVDFGQTQAWAPSTNRGPWGKRLWWMRWVFTAAGWIISALGAAAITGVIRRE